MFTFILSHHFHIKPVKYFMENKKKFTVRDFSSLPSKMISHKISDLTFGNHTFLHIATNSSINLDRKNCCIVHTESRTDQNFGCVKISTRSDSFENGLSIPCVRVQRGNRQTLMKKLNFERLCCFFTPIYPEGMRKSNKKCKE